MSGLVPQTRVSWGLGVMKGGERSLHLLKRDYRGRVKYYSKSARSSTEKNPFGQVKVKPHILSFCSFKSQRKKCGQEKIKSIIR